MTDRKKSLIVVICMFVVLLLSAIVAEKSYAHEEYCASPNVQLVKLEKYRVVVNPGGIFNQATLYVNNEYKRYRVNDSGYITYRSEFPIQYVRATVWNDCGRTIRTWRR